MALRAISFMQGRELINAPDAASKNLHNLLDTIFIHRFILTGEKLI